MSFGPTTNNRKFGLWVYIDQPSGPHFDEWKYDLINSYVGLSTNSLGIVVNIAMDGQFSQVNIMYGYLRVSSVITELGVLSRFPDHYTIPCYLNSEFEPEPNCINPGCGNGIHDSIIDSSSEQCDDGNISNGDGCSDTCQIENIHSCTTSSDIFLTHTWINTWGDFEITPDNGEEWDDGNLSGNILIHKPYNI